MTPALLVLRQIVQPATVGRLRQVSRAKRLYVNACAITHQASSSWNPLSRQKIYKSRDDNFLAGALEVADMPRVHGELPLCALEAPLKAVLGRGCRCVIIAGMQLGSDG